MVLKVRTRVLQPEPLEVRRLMTAVQIADIIPGNASSGPDDLTAVGATLFFSASDTTHGNELWKSTGSTGGAQLVKDINPSGDSFIGNTVAFNNKLYFTAYDGVTSNVLWTCDGSPAGTQTIASFNSIPYGLTVYNNKLYFVADDGSHGAELWRTDGV